MSQCAHKMRLLDTTFFCVERTGHQCAHTYRFLESDVRRFAARAERAEAERDALRALLRRVLSCGLNEYPPGAGFTPSKQERLAGELARDIKDALREGK